MYSHLKAIFCYLVIIVCLFSCKKQGSDIKKETSISTDSSKVNPAPPSLPPNVATSFGSSNDSWIIGMHTNIGLIEQGEQYSIANDNSGNVYILFTFYGTVDLDPEPNVVLGGSDAEAKTMLVKYSATGKLLWFKKFETTGSLQPGKIKIGTKGDIYFTLNCKSANNIYFGNDNFTTENDRTGLLIKVSETGSIIWRKEIGFDSLSQKYWGISDLTTDINGNVYLAGNYYFQATVYDNNKHLIENSNPGKYPSLSDFYVKYDSNGKYITSHSTIDSYVYSLSKSVYTGSPSGSYSPLRATITVDNNENVFLAGYYFSVEPYSRYTGNYIKTTLIDAASVNENDEGSYLTKFSKEGTWVWLKLFPQKSNSIATEFQHITADKYGNIYLLGDYDDYLSPPNYQNPVFYGRSFLKVDNEGKTLWSTTLSTPFKEKRKISLILDNQDQPIVVTDNQTTTGFDPGALSNRSIKFYKYSTSGSILSTKVLMGYSVSTAVTLGEVAYDKNSINLVGYFIGSVKLLNTVGDPRNDSDTRYTGDFNCSLFIAHFPDF